jgi:type I restriction enzyme S subunit
MEWSNQKLGDYCEVIAGQSPEGKYYNDSGEGLPFYQGKKEFGDRFLGSPKKWTSKVTKEAKAGDILMSVRAPVGPINFSTQDICIGRGLAAIRSSDKLDKDFLFYYLLSKQDEIQGSEGAVFASINKAQIEALSFSYVEIKEQKRIVAILDQAFADIEQARSKTEQNLKNARELFESYLQQVFSQRGEGWETQPLAEIAELVDSLHTTPSYIETGGFPMVRVTEIKKSGLSLKKARRVDEETYEKFSKRHKSAVGDIILSRVGASYGIPVIVETDEPFCLGQNTIFILPKINSYWLYYFLLSPIAKGQIDRLAAGSAQPTVSMKSIRSLSVPIAPRLKQDEFEWEIKNASIQSEELINTYVKKLELLDELKKSILQKAFSGELTKTPDSETSKGAAA